MDDKRAGETKTRVSFQADVDAEAVWLSKNGDEKLIKFEVCRIQYLINCLYIMKYCHFNFSGQELERQ